MNRLTKAAFICRQICLKRNMLKSLFRNDIVTVATRGKAILTPRRAVLYVPGHDRRKIEKIASLDVDCVVLDCEDGVAANKKHEARTVICEIAQYFNFGRTEYAVRVNSIQSGLAEDDISSFLSSKRLPDAVMVPKVESVEHVHWINNQLRSYLEPRELKKKLNLVLFVESAKSLLDLREICKKTIELSIDGPFTMVGLVFGSDDFCADIGATRTPAALELLTARQMIVMIAKSFNLQVIDMVHINYKDLDGLRKLSKEGALMGFTGKQVIHPSQIPVVQDAFSPSKERIEWAVELTKLFEEHQQHGKGAFTFRGAMIDKPLLLQAEYVIKVAQTLKRN